ncbi:hypothetical protein A9995_04945 [Erythrobacter sp. QSSC1-22B]|nr:hypothetical protein A9995_04945 [Erythrobacter sp. QSSC1-22B]
MTGRKAVLLVRSDMKLAGPGISMHAIARAVRAKGWHVEIASGGGALKERLEADGFRHHEIAGLRVDDRTPLRMIAGVRALRRLLAKPDFVVAHSFNAHAGLMSWIAGRGSKVKNVNTVVGSGKERFLRFMPFPFIAVSHFVAEQLAESGVNSDRVRTIHNSTIPEWRILSDVQAFEQLWRKRSPLTPFRLVNIGMMNGDKGQKAVLEMMVRLRRIAPETPVALELVGEGACRAELERFANRNGLGGTVKFAGALNDVYPALDRAHAMIHLSPEETFGIVLAEAQARGLPAVAYGVGGIPEVVSGGSTGLIVEPSDVDEAAAAVLSLARSPHKAKKLGRSGLSRCRRLFPQSVLADAHDDAYRQLCSA